jgi:hypothetical protein
MDSASEWVVRAAAQGARVARAEPGPDGVARLACDPNFARREAR